MTDNAFDTPAYRASLKAAGKLAADYRDDWALPKALRGPGATRARKSKKADKAAVDALRVGAPGGLKVAYGLAVDDDPAPPDAVGDITPVTEPVFTVTNVGAQGEDAGQGDSGDALDDADLDGVDDIAWNRNELKRLRTAKSAVCTELMLIQAGDKDGLALVKQKLAVLESQEESCIKALSLFNKKRLEAGAAQNKVLIEIKPWSGDGTKAVQAWM